MTLLLFILLLFIIILLQEEIIKNFFAFGNEDEVVEEIEPPFEALFVIINGDVILSVIPPSRHLQ